MRRRERKGEEGKRTDLAGPAKGKKVGITRSASAVTWSRWAEQVSVTGERRWTKLQCEERVAVGRQMTI